MRNLRIGTKLQLMNLLLILTVLLLTAFSFRVLSVRYLLQEARQQIRSDANILQQVLSENQVLSREGVQERVGRRKELRVAGRMLDTKVVVVGSAGRILYNTTGFTSRQLASLQAGETPEGYLVARNYIKESAGVIRGEVILGAKISDITGLTRVLRRAQLISIIIGGLLALLLGYFLGRSLSRPLAELAAGMRSFSPKRNEPLAQASGQSRDEIGELAASFSGMTGKLRRNDKLQTDFLQNASHELKTPLMAIQGNAEAVMDGIVQGAEAQRSLEIIVKECQQLKGLVDEMIYLTRLDEIAENYSLEQIRIGSLLDTVLDSLQGTAARGGIRLSVTGDLTSQLWADREKLKRAFINIVGNALRYAESAVSLEVKQAGKQLLITCRDDGQGFNPGEEDLVFDRFYKGKKGGTGIGLAITKAIVEGHGGTITASNGPGSGAVFELVLQV